MVPASSTGGAAGQRSERRERPPRRVSRAGDALQLDRQYRIAFAFVRTGDGGARAVAVAWAGAVMDDGDLRRAWPVTDPNLRLVLVQHWIWSNRGKPAVGPKEGWEALADALSACPSTHPLWERFASERVERWQQFWSGFSPRTWRVRDEPEVLDNGLEIVTFVQPRDDGSDGRPGPPPVFRRFAMRHSADGWLVAGLDGTALFRPGWPPSQA